MPLEKYRIQGEERGSEGPDGGAATVVGHLGTSASHLLEAYPGRSSNLDEWSRKDARNLFI